jgi:hypothetical protein
MSNTERYIEIEYRELCAYHRHQRELTWKIGSILITASLAVFGIVASRFEVLPLSALVPLGAVSIFTIAFFWFVFERISFLNDAIKARMREIEKEFGMYIVRTYEGDSRYRTQTHHKIGSFLHVRWIVRLLFGVYVVAWILLWTLK